MNKTFRVAIILALSAGSILSQTVPASAQYRDGGRWDDRRGPPPRWDHRDRDRDRDRRHHNNGSAIAGGLAAGVIGGLIGGAIANGGNNSGPRYIDPPPPPQPRCWYEDRRVANAYDGGYHVESLRVCN